MKAIRFMQPEVIEYSDIPAPQVKDNEVLAKIAYAGFCATDIELLTGEMVHIKNGNTKYPIIPGHEWSGTIVEVGKNVRDFKVGDRITSDVSLGCGECDECRKGHYNLCPNREVIGSYKNRQGVFAEYVAVPQRHVYKIPDGLSMEEAALAEPAATAMYAVSKAKIPAGAEVLVIGDGPIGQLAAQLANIAGASKVIMAGSWDEKLAIAKECGIHETINYHKEDVVQRAKELTEAGPEIVIETSGSNAALNMAVQALKPTGRIVAELVQWSQCGRGDEYGHREGCGVGRLSGKSQLLRTGAAVYGLRQTEGKAPYHSCQAHGGVARCCEDDPRQERNADQGTAEALNSGKSNHRRDRLKRNF